MRDYNFVKPYRLERNAHHGLRYTNHTREGLPSHAIRKEQPNVDQAPYNT